MEELSLNPGTLISNRYEVLQVIGTGGMGVVYRVRDRLLRGKEIALKALMPEFASDPSYVERFFREVELMNRVTHPNVVRTFDMGKDGSMIYFTMELVNGVALDELLERGPLPMKDIPRLLVQICKGLQAIHDAEILHRDLKPGNVILLADGTLKITDFGVARPKHSQLTRRNERVGSIWYMAPEAWEGATLDRRADIYSLGVLLFEVVTGVLPFDSDNPSQLMELHRRQSPPRPSRIRADIPIWLERIILQLLSKSPKERPSSAMEVIELVTLNSSGSSLNVLSSGTRAAIRPALKEAIMPSVTSSSGHRKGTRYKRKKTSLLVVSPVTTFLIALVVATLLLMLLQRLG